MRIDEIMIEPYQFIEEARNEVERIDLELIAREGINVDTTKWDFIYFYPPIDSLLPFEGQNTPFHSEVNNVSPIALYFHLPFCTGLCTYCYFMKYELPSNEVVDRYLNYLRKEVSLVSEKIRNKSVHSIMIGGGTPSLLSDKQLIYLFGIIRDNFDIRDTTEISIEISPETITIEKLELLKELGAKRISMGVQSFDDKILKKTNRRHSSGGTLSAIYKIQSAGLNNYNMDMIYGLPEQNIDSVWHDLKIIEGIRPRSLTFYQLWFHSEEAFVCNVPMNLLPKQFFPDIKTILTMKVLIRKFMDTLGYQQDMICWFIKSEKERYHYDVFRWENNPYLGFGLSSYGYLNGWAYLINDNYFFPVTTIKIPVFVFL